MIHIDLSNDIDRADELVFNIPSEIAAIEKLKVTKFQERNDAIGVIAEVLGFCGDRSRQWVLWLVWESRNDFLICSQNAETYSSSLQ